MKKIIALILALILSSLTLFSCSDYYPPKESTKKEATVVMTLAYGEETYEIKYELYRALFLTLKHDVDKGDSSVWQGAKKGEYIDKINQLIFARLGDIYAVFSLAKEIGVDVYSEEYDEMVLEIVKASVDSESIGEVKYTGFGGDYDAYLDSLKEMNLNYSVQDLMIRYALAMDDIHYHYGGNVENDANLGNLGYTREDVLAFYNSDECVRVYQLFLSALKTSYDKERAENLRDKIASKDTEEEVIATMIGNSTYGEDIKNGEIIGKYNLDSFYYSSLTEAAFELSYYETSPVISIASAVDEGFYILYKTRKSDEHFDACYDKIAAVYVENTVGKMISDRSAKLLENLKETETYSEINHASISMDEE